MNPFQMLRSALSSQPAGNTRIAGAGHRFLIMSNARAGSSYFQSSLSALGAVGDFEFSLRPFSPPRPHQRFLSAGIEDVASEIRSAFGANHVACGSKLTLPIYEYLTQDDIEQLARSCRNISRPIHLVRDYWELLKSNLSRGVAHHFAPQGRGWPDNSRMREAYSNLPESGLGPEKPSVPVQLSEEALRNYLLNLLRNDYAFATIGEECGVTSLIVHYETLGAVEGFKRVLGYLDMNRSDDEIANVIANPLLKRLPTIPDSNIPHEASLHSASAACYAYYRDGDAGGQKAERIFEAQLGEIKRAFG